MPRLSVPESSQAVWGPERRWWVLNPGPRLPICFDEGVTDFVFSQKTYQFKSNMSMSPRRSIEAYARGRAWRAILVEYYGTCAMEFDSEHGWDNPVGVYPSWSNAENSWDELEAILDDYPEPGEPVGFFFGMAVELACMYRQDRVVIIRNPPSTPTEWETFFRRLLEYKNLHPDIIFHIHGGKSVTRTIGTGVDSFDHPVTTRWIDGEPCLILPSGKEYGTHRKSEKNPDRWASLIGMHATSLLKIEDRQTLSNTMYRFNLRSLKWAFSNYEKFWSLRVADESQMDVDSSDASWVPVDLAYRPRLNDVTDKWLCDLCSLSTRCPYSRPGAICIVDDSDASPLAKTFGTRRVTDIRDILEGLIANDLERVGAATIKEREAMENGVLTLTRTGHEITVEGGLDPELTKLSMSVYERVVMLGRIYDPAVAAALAPPRAGGSGGGVINVPRPLPVGPGQEPTATEARQLGQLLADKVRAAGLDPETMTDAEMTQFIEALSAGGSLPVDDDDGDPDGDG